VRHNLVIILKLARDTALPMDGEEVPVLKALVKLFLEDPDEGEQNGQAIERCPRAQLD